MLTTEEDARTKLCPFQSHCINESGVIQHYEPPVYHPAMCAASECMAWRWGPLPIDGPEWVTAVQKAAEEIGDSTPNKRKAVRFVAENRERFGLPTRPTRGWCRRLSDTKTEA
ncbi:hypothetical protein PQJ75_01015 [Rhodoplanes sp. TEM]|uniref:Uncharacterized protein n=1 Tax=Rhodoplanes tepidamans TaxID=200616 RepID=A0ABT5J6C2_RHOTP|nr:MULTISPECIES: hypothetical protein [Rhodoplanes]MDC7784834.1 hypothetical protein [Rhodoplanes tepidamans]MDC7982301.1 hypothetical protein [Rhodoplanes sp. TEM]MDQ0356309.1 hypothetical protein [Rhodoplanes tepidamans]